MMITEAKNIQNGAWKPVAVEGLDSMALLERVESFVKKAQVCVLGVSNESGAPSMKAVSIPLRDGIGKLWFTMHRSAMHSGFLRKRPECSLYAYSDKTWEGILLTGKIVIDNDPEVKKKCWQEYYKDSFPGGLDDPQYCCYRFEFSKADYTDCQICFSLEP